MRLSGAVHAFAAGVKTWAIRSATPQFCWVGAYMQAAAVNFGATFQGDRLEEIAGHLEAIFNVVGAVAAKFS